MQRKGNIMKKLKDLIYDYNDIFVALLIIAVAGAIILWRVTNIMDYPDYLAGKEQTQTGDVDFSDVDLTPEVVDDFNQDPDEITTQTPDDTAGEQTPAEEQTPEGGAVQPADGTPVTVDIPKGSSANGIAKILKEAGLIDDVDAFLETVEKLDATMKMKYGTYKIPQGSTAEEIVDILM